MYRPFQAQVDTYLVYPSSRRLWNQECGRGTPRPPTQHSQQVLRDGDRLQWGTVLWYHPQMEL